MNNSEPKGQDGARQAANTDKQQGLPPRDTQQWSDAQRQNYNNQYYGTK